MNDTQRDDVDPRDEPDAEAARTGSADTLANTSHAENAEPVLDPDAERPEQEASAHAERIEAHNRPTSEPAGPGEDPRD
jgi:hypothetical protein